jgi:hypothetical protein
MRFIIALILAVIATPVRASDRGTQLIIVDNRDICGPARLAYHKRADAVAAAQRLARNIERERNVATRVIVLEPGQAHGQFQGGSSAPSPIFVNNPC